jgi:hypothetical protein
VSGSTPIAPLRSIDTKTRAGKRHAVVIGNSTYSAIPSLPNARADAEVMADFLRSQDYIVHHHADTTKRGFEDVLRRILFDVDKDTEVVVFFAGHGFQIGAGNCLVPVDADLETVCDIPFEAVSLVSIVGARATTAPSPPPWPPRPAPILIPKSRTSSRASAAMSMRPPTAARSPGTAPP